MNDRQRMRLDGALLEHADTATRWVLADRDGQQARSWNTLPTSGDVEAAVEHVGARCTFSVYLKSQRVAFVTLDPDADGASAADVQATLVRLLEAQVKAQGALLAGLGGMVEKTGEQALGIVRLIEDARGKEQQRHHEQLEAERTALREQLEREAKLRELEARAERGIVGELAAAAMEDPAAAAEVAAHVGGQLWTLWQRIRGGGAPPALGA